MCSIILWPADFEACCVSVMQLDFEKQTVIFVSQMENANEMPVYFYVPSTYTVNDGAKFVVIKTSNYEKICVTCLVGGISRWQTIHDSESQDNT
jgi:hypothetical protein